MSVPAKITWKSRLTLEKVGSSLQGFTADDYAETVHIRTKTIVNKFAISNHTASISGVRALRSYVKQVCEYNNNVHFKDVRFICSPHLAIIGPSEAMAT